MPFTFSHPAIILPLKYLPKSWFSFTALIIGSLAPDFEYFIRMRVKSNYSHTISGIFWFDLPLVIILSFIFHNIIKNQLYKNLPYFIRNKAVVYIEFDWNNYFKKNWLIVLISGLIGITSHIFWDSFTHNHGYFVNQIAFLRNIISFIGIEIPLWKIAQHTSSLVGGIFILILFSKLPSDLNSRSNISKRYWVSVFSSTLFIMAFRFALNINSLSFGNLIVSCIASFFISLIIIPLFNNFFRHKNLNLT